MWYIIRHGETSHNKLGIKQGHYPSILNMKGIEQSKAIANQLLKLEKNLDEYKFISSPLLRTRQTIDIIMNILEINQEPIHEDLIKSRSKGIFENLSKDFIKKNFANEIKKRDEDHWNYAPPSGESFAEIYEKIVKFLDKYKYKEEENLIIVLHGGNSPILRGLISKQEKNTIVKERSSHNQDYFYKWDGNKIEKIKIKKQN